MTKHTPEFIQPQLPFDEIPYGYCHCGCGQKTSINAFASKRRGISKGEPSRYLKGHSVIPRTIEMKFWACLSVGEPDACWEWRGNTSAKGYGVFNYRKAHHMAHRFSYEIHIGFIPEGMVICHKCDNPPCCNPAHLFVGTRADNNADMVAKGRQVTLAGESNVSAKVTEIDCIEIRRMYADGISQPVIAKQFNITQANVSSVVTRKTWKHVP